MAFGLHVARGIEAYVIHPTSIPVSREHRRAKTDRLDDQTCVSVRGTSAFAAELRHEPICKGSYRRSLSAGARVDQAVTNVADIVSASCQRSDQSSAREFALGQEG